MTRRRHRQLGHVRAPRTGDDHPPEPAGEAQCLPHHDGRDDRELRPLPQHGRVRDALPDPHRRGPRLLLRGRCRRTGPAQQPQRGAQATVASHPQRDARPARAARLRRAGDRRAQRLRGGHGLRARPRHRPAHSPGTTRASRWRSSSAGCSPTTGSGTSCRSSWASSRGLELMLTARMIDAQEALDLRPRAPGRAEGRSTGRGAGAGRSRS